MGRFRQLSDLDDAMEVHMAYIVFIEGRPFSYKDFVWFQVDNKDYGMNHGTFRNKIVVLKKSEVVELDYNSGIAFYTLKGHRFGKPMTPNHTVVPSDPIYTMLQNLPFDKKSIHDIHLKFKAPFIWKMISLDRNLHRNQRSQDISIPTWIKNNVLIRTIIHKTDTVTVSLRCSLEPIPLDAYGVVDFFDILIRTEEKLQSIIDNLRPINHETNISIPEYREWIITMWHFGRDASIEPIGRMFSITVRTLQNILIRIYIKEVNGEKRLRIEKQQYPNKTVLHAMEDILNRNY